MLRRFVLASVAASACVLAFGNAASAHIDPDPTTAQAGSRLTVGFTVEHGCEGSPTIQLDMRLPEGVADPTPDSLDGWEGSVRTIDGDAVVTFVGGPLADDVEGTFSVTMTLPPTPDTTIYFPFVQRCEVGEIRWIGIPAEPGDELDEPAPAMALTGPVVTVPPTVPATGPVATVPSTVPTTAPSTEPATLPASTEPSADASTAPSTSEPLVITADGDETDGSGTGTLVFIASIAAVVALGAFVVYRSRQARAGTTPEDR